jgi:putative DNA primase/helicase
LTEKGGKVLWTCRAGCSKAEVTRAILEKCGPAAPAPASPARKSKSSAFDWATAQIFPYRDENSELLFEVGRCDGVGNSKTIQQRRRVGKVWSYKLAATRRVLWLLRDVLEASTVYVCEGEGKAKQLNEALSLAGLYGEHVATTAPGGAGKWHPSYSQTLAGKRVVVLPDNDEPGRKHADQVLAATHGQAASLKLLKLPNLPHKGDVVQFLEAGGTLQQLRQLAEAAPEWEPTTAASSEPPSSADFPLDEIGNGQRFAALHGATLRRCSVRECWLVYGAGRWHVDDQGDAERHAKATARQVAADAGREADDDKRARLLRHALSLTKRATRETMLKDAASEPGISTTPEVFDGAEHLLNLANCTLDLRTRTARPHAAGDLLTMQSAVTYDPQAECPIWRACLARWLPDEGTRNFIQDAAGATLTGQVFEEFFTFLHGDGDNGKSTFLRVLEQLLGTYSHKTQAETLMQARDNRQANAPAPDVLALKGARLVTAHEIDSRHQVNAALLKDLTGRDSITARGLFEKRLTTFVPQFTLWLVGNSKPQIRDTSGGMWRRVRLVHFGQPIAADERDPQLGDKLRLELPGVLNWALDGLQRVQAQGLSLPPAVQAATAEYRAEQDSLADFIQERCTTGPDSSATAGDLWAAWKAWARAGGVEEGTQRAFGARLKQRFTSYKSSGAAKWRGVGLVSHSEESSA